jgi:hypothetical protein
MLGKGFEIELSDFEVGNVVLKSDFLWQLVEIVIGGVLTVFEINWMYFIMSLGRVLLKGSALTNLCDPMRYQVDLQKVEVGIIFRGNIYIMVYIILPGIHFVQLLGWCLNVSIIILVYLSHLHKFRCQGIGISLCFFAGSPK